MHDYLNNDYFLKQYRITYDRLLAKAQELDLELLSTFEETTVKLARVHFRCKKGHLISRRKDMTFKTFTRCEFCKGVNSRVGQENVALLLKEQGWEYVSGEYKDKQSVLTAKCLLRGHLVTKRYRAFKDGCIVCQPINRISGVRGLGEEAATRGIKLDFDAVGTIVTETPIPAVCAAGHRFFTSRRKLLIDQNGCPSCAKSQQTSSGEREIAKFLTDNGYEVEGPVKAGKFTCDIMVPKHSLGIEFNGTYFHSEAVQKNRNYHLDKFENAKEQGFSLFQFWEDEWYGSRSIVESMLLAKLRHPSVALIDARKCLLGKIDPAEAKVFLQEHHLLGPTVFSEAIGLKYQGELVVLVCLGHHHRAQAEPEVLLSRLCTRKMTVVRGGFSRLLSVIPPGLRPVFTFSDNRFSTGAVYEKAGFTRVHEVKPDYQYVRQGKRHSKHSLRLTPEEKITGKPEGLLRAEQGFVRLFDAGKAKWVLK